MSVSTSLRFYLLLSFSYIVPTHQAGMFIATKQCFFSNGQISDQDTPCRPNASSTESFCCNSTQRCLAGGICQTTDLVKYPGPEFSRPSCTDQRWKSEACPRYCPDAKSSASPSIQSCDSSTFCCAANITDTNCCSSGSPLFVLPDNFESTPQNATGIPTPFQSVVRGSSSSPMAAPMAAPMTTPSSHPTTHPKYLSLPIKLAIGFSTALFIALLFYALLYFLKRRSRKQRSAATANGKYPSRSSSDASYISIFNPRFSKPPATDVGIVKKHVKKASISRPLMVIQMQSASAISSPRTPPPPPPMDMSGGDAAMVTVAPSAVSTPAPPARTAPTMPILPPSTFSPPARSAPQITPTTAPATPVSMSANGTISHISRPDLGGLRSVHAPTVPDLDPADAPHEGPSSNHPPFTPSWLRPRWLRPRRIHLSKLASKSDVQESGWARTRAADAEAGEGGRKGKMKIGAVRKVHEVLGREAEPGLDTEQGSRQAGGRHGGVRFDLGA